MHIFLEYICYWCFYVYIFLWLQSSKEQHLFNNLHNLSFLLTLLINLMHKLGHKIFFLLKNAFYLLINGGPQKEVLIELTSGVLPAHVLSHITSHIQPTKFPKKCLGVGVCLCVCMCVCVCVCVFIHPCVNNSCQGHGFSQHTRSQWQSRGERERAREKERGRERERKRGRERFAHLIRVYNCNCMFNRLFQTNTIKLTISTRIIFYLFKQ